MKPHIYTVHITEDRERRTIVVLVAETAELAGQQAVRAGGFPEGTETEVGVLGSYDPGITGASLSQGSVIAIQRIGAR